MSILVRKITKSKWPDSICLGVESETMIEEVPADAITSCLRTSKNTLSVWEVENEEGLEEAALALVTSAQKLENIDIIYIDKAILLDYKFIIKDDVPGATSVEDLKNTHRDISDLNYKRIGEFAYIVAKSISNSKFKRFTRKKLIKIINKAIDENRLQIDTLNDNIKKDILKCS